MPIYHHVSSVQHPPGYIIQPGRYGSLFANKPSTVDDGFVMTWEAVLETARLTSMPDAPSRLNCIFGVPSATDGQTFRTKYRPNALIIRIDVSPTTPIYFGDFDLISNAQPGTYIDRWARNAIDYWTLPPVGMKEVIIGGPATVL